MAPFLSPTYDAVLHSLGQNSKHSHRLTRPDDSPTDKGEQSQEKLDQRPCQDSGLSSSSILLKRFSYTKSIKKRKTSESHKHWHSQKNFKIAPKISSNVEYEQFIDFSSIKSFLALILRPMLKRNFSSAARDKIKACRTTFVHQTEQWAESKTIFPYILIHNNT